MDETTFKLVVDAVIEGATLKSACAKNNTNVFLLHRYISNNPEAEVYFNRAQEIKAETLADEIVEISDNRDLDSSERNVMIAARKWVASKLKPKKFGEKLDVNVNQTVDIRAALSEAARRVIDVKAAVIDPPKSLDSFLTHPDLKSVSDIENDGMPLKSSPQDLFPEK